MAKNSLTIAEAKPPTQHMRMIDVYIIQREGTKYI